MVRRRQIWAGLVAATVAAGAWFGALCWQRATLDSPPASFMLLDRHGAFLAQIGGSEAAGYGYWPPPAGDDRVVQALEVLEDRRFWSEPGVDPIAIARAAWQNLAAGRRISGASSIAMQVARLQRPERRTLWHKAVEAGTAMLLVARYGHQRVLDQYLRLVPFGNNSHGVAHAARFYFDKPAADLSWAEIALLSALPQAPGRLNPLTPAGKAAAIARGQRVLDDLRQAGTLADRDYRIARQELAGITLADRAARPRVAMHAILRLEAMLGGADAWLAGHQEARVVSTIDLGLQRQVEALAGKRLAAWQGGGAEQVSMGVVDRASGQVLAWIGSADYFGARAGAIDYGQVARSPGSTLKPFLYGLALDEGLIRPDRPVGDTPEEAPGIENADRLYLGSLLPAQALANSRNAPAAALVRRIGVDGAYDFLGGLGLHPADGAGERDGQRYGLGLAVGAMPTSLEQLLRAYAALANDGQVSDLAWYRGQFHAAPRPMLSPAAAREITLFLADPMARLPSFSRMGPTEFPFPVAVKTGTSQDYRDAWTVAYSPQYVVGVWVGRADDRPMNALGGINSAAGLAHDVMMALHDRAPPAAAQAQFAPPDGYRQISVCGAAGPNPCATEYREWVPVAELVDAAAPIRPTPAVARPARLTVVEPTDGARFLHNPDSPPGADAITLRARVVGNQGPLVWSVDGQPYGVAAPGEALSWPLQRGPHVVGVFLKDHPDVTASASFAVK